LNKIGRNLMCNCCKCDCHKDPGAESDALMNKYLNLYAETKDVFYFNQAVYYSIEADLDRALDWSLRHYND